MTSSHPAHVHSLTLPHYPTHPIHIALFRSVRNAAHLRAHLLQADPAYDYAFLDASTILSYTHLLLAAQLALHAHLTHRRKTRTPHSELVFRLHPNNNIADSYRSFGIADHSSHIIAVRFGLTPDVSADSVRAHLAAIVDGACVEIGDRGDELATFADLPKIRKIYKLNHGGKGAAAAAKKAVVNAKAGAGGSGSEERSQMESLILGAMVLKGS